MRASRPRGDDREVFRHAGDLEDLQDMRSGRVDDELATIPHAVPSGDEHTNSRRVEELEVTTVEDDPSGATRDQLVEQVA